MCKIFVTEQVITELFEYSRKNHPKETGGILMGVYVKDIPWVTHVVHIDSPISSRSYYQIPSNVRPQIIKQVKYKDSRIGYLGEWHSHPRNIGPSPLDIITIIKIANDKRANCKRPLLFVNRRIGQNYKLDARQLDCIFLKKVSITYAGPLISDFNNKTDERQEFMASKNNTVDLNLIFNGIQEQMKSSLNMVRSEIQHPGAKGIVNEESWRQLLVDYLPTRYNVEKAFIIDSDGNISQEIDLVIFDRQYTPLLFKANGATYIPIESVYMVLEVKQEISKSNIEYAGKKAESVRLLNRTSAPIVDAGILKEPRPLFEIPAGILALDSDWNPPFGDSFIKVIQSLETNCRINFGCVLNQGTFQLRYSKDTVPESTISKRENSLISFLFQLLQMLQQLGTVPAVKYSEYSKNIGK